MHWRLSSKYLTVCDCKWHRLADAVRRSYPDNNCAAAFPDAGFGPPRNPQDVFSEYLTHGSPVGTVAPYLNSSMFSQQNNKPFLMFETNSASCGGFPGVSDSFGISLWMSDYALQMAYGNFSGAMLHVGGIDDTYNVSVVPLGALHRR